MIAAIIDIGSGSVGLGGVLLEKGKVPNLKFSERIELTLQDPLDPSRLFQESLNATRQVIADMQKERIDAPLGIFCFLSPHLVISQTRKIFLNLPGPTKISALTINNAVDKELVKFKEDRGKDEVVIEHKIMSVKLNGYETANLNDRVASEVEISIFFTLAPLEMLNSIKKEISASFHNEQIEFHSFSSAHFTVLRDIFQSERGFTFLDIGSEITDISIVKEGILERSISFPLGKNSIVRSIMKKTEASVPIALSTLKNATLKGPADTALSSEAGGRWLEALKKAVNSDNLEDKIPSKIFILADKNVSGIFKNLIEGAGLNNSLTLGQEPEVKELTSADLNNFCGNYSGSVDDLFLMISSIFVNKLLN